MQEESEKARERDAFCTIDKENLCEPRTNLLPVYNNVFIWVGELRLKTLTYMGGDLFPWDFNVGEIKTQISYFNHS